MRVPAEVASLVLPDGVVLHVSPDARKGRGYTNASPVIDCKRWGHRSMPYNATQNQTDADAVIYVVEGAR